MLAGLSCTDLAWVGLGWPELVWVVLVWSEKAGLGWSRLSWLKNQWSVVGFAGLSGLQWPLLDDYTMFYGASHSLTGWSKLVLRQRQALRERRVSSALAQCHAYPILPAKISYRLEHIHRVGKWTLPLEWRCCSLIAQSVDTAGQEGTGCLCKADHQYSAHMP